MVFGRLDDDYATHPKIVAAGPLAMALDVAASCYANRHLTDGFVPSGMVPMLLNLSGYLDDADPLAGNKPERLGVRVDALELAERLVQVRRWERVDGGFQVHDFLEFNRSRLEVEAERSANAQRQASFRANRRSNGARNGVSNAGSNGSSHAASNGVTQALLTPLSQQRNRGPIPIPIPKDLSSSSNEEDSSPAAATSHALRDEFFGKCWAAYPKRHGKRLNQPRAAAAFGKLDAGDWPLVLQAVERYAQHCQADDEYPSDMFRWLAEGRKATARWREWIREESPAATAAAPAPLVAVVAPAGTAVRVLRLPERSLPASVPGAVAAYAAPGAEREQAGDDEAFPASLAPEQLKEAMEAFG